jgi:purine-binding chemotaxis protein CheW
VNSLVPTAAEAKADAAHAAQFVGFRLADQGYAFPIGRIQEIVIPSATARVPEVPAYVEGVANLRGTIIPIINLRLLFGLEPRIADGETRTVVVNLGPRTIGCTVDAVTRVMRIAADHIQPPPDAVVQASRPFIQGFARVGEDLLIVLDVDNLLDPANLDAVHRAGVGQAGI